MHLIIKYTYTVNTDNNNEQIPVRLISNTGVHKHVQEHICV